MPLELTQSRVQKIWIPVDHRPSLPRCECGPRGWAQGRACCVPSRAIVWRALAGSFVPTPLRRGAGAALRDCPLGPAGERSSPARAGATVAARRCRGRWRGAGAATPLAGDGGAALQKLLVRGCLGKDNLPSIP